MCGRSSPPGRRSAPTCNDYPSGEFLHACVSICRPDSCSYMRVRGRVVADAWAACVWMHYCVCISPRTRRLRRVTLRPRSLALPLCWRGIRGVASAGGGKRFCVQPDNDLPPPPLGRLTDYALSWLVYLAQFGTSASKNLACDTVTSPCPAGGPSCGDAGNPQNHPWDRARQRFSREGK